SGLYFEAYIAGFGASIAAGGRYDDMLARFGYDCPAVGFAFDVARALAIMETQRVTVELPGPDFFIIDYARAQRVRHVLVVGSPRSEAGELLVLDLKQGRERKVPVADALADPVKYFGEL